MLEPLCKLDDIPLVGVLPINIENSRYLLYREGDQVFGCEAICPHMGGALEEGKIEHGCVTCPQHGWRFDLKSGHCENVKGQQLRRLELFVEGAVVYYSRSSIDFLSM